MERRNFIKVMGLSAFAVSSTGFKLIEKDGLVTADCATSRDMLGPFFRKGAPQRNQITFKGNNDEVPLKVIGKLFGADCNTPLANKEIDIWHCDHQKNYDMKSADFACRGKLFSNEKGEYWYQTFIPPPYGGRPKHIHYLIQLYFKGDKKIKPNNWVKYPWDERRILQIYKNAEGIAEVNLDLFLKAK
jgi:protocatechuate 3,4-dioxygenase beta subunit